jgi:hypothetical protein
MHALARFKDYACHKGELIFIFFLEGAIEKLAKFSKTERTTEVHALTNFRKYSFVLQLSLPGWAAHAERTSTALRLSLLEHLYTHGIAGSKKHCLKEKFLRSILQK